MNVYKYRSGRAVKNLDPQTVGEELDSIRKEHGTLTPALTVDRARDEANPLHAAFEWNDAVAAEEHRLGQARRLIVSVRVVNAKYRAPVPAFVSVRTPERGREYKPVAEALDSDQLAARIMDEVRQFIEALERKYVYFAEVRDLLASLRGKVG